ncbi:unnamed protein product [Brassica oleracea]
MFFSEPDYNNETNALVKKFMFEFGLIAQCGHSFFGLRVDKDSELADVEAVSAGNNYELGNMIAEAMAKVGCKGVVTLEEGKSFVILLQLLLRLLDLERGRVSTLTTLLLLWEVRPMTKSSFCSPFLTVSSLKKKAMTRDHHPVLNGLTFLSLFSENE